MLSVLLTALYVVVCLLLLIVVLMQQGKGGGLTANFGGSGSDAAFGARAGASVLTPMPSRPTPRTVSCQPCRPPRYHAAARPMNCPVLRSKWYCRGPLHTGTPRSQASSLRR